MPYVRTLRFVTFIVLIFALASQVAFAAGPRPADEVFKLSVQLDEETGIELHPTDLVGPVFTRSAIFDFYAEHCRQDEVLYLARVPADAFGDGHRAGWTELELDVIDELRWWSLDDLERVDIEVFPDTLVALVRGLLPAWDGVTRHLGLARE